jgi:cellulose synthase/poly-beta-1,6-N-acetylglucosamine synthase-like glycosyltransferase
MLTVAATLLILLTVYYSWFLLRARAGLNALKKWEHHASPNSLVSVVIAARNEEGTIADCLKAVLGQHYPRENLEIIVVDDHSSDRTADIANAIAQQHEKVHLVSLQASPDKNVSGKPEAIAKGVEAARGEIIFTTDADCSVPPDWIATIVRYFAPDVALVAGPVQVPPGRKFLAQLDHLELLGLVTMAAGLIGAGRPIIANGANLAYRKIAFREALGFGHEQAWCDDETIMQRIHRRRLGRIVFAPEQAATVTTVPSTLFVSFWKQRLRWSSKGGHYEETSLLLSLVLLYFYFLFLLTMAVVTIFHSSVLPWVAASLVVKVITDLVTLQRGRRILSGRISPIVFLIAEIFHVPYIVVTAALGQFVSFSWKGRTVNS